VLAQLFTAKVAAFATVALFTAGTAAAATGNLPDRSNGVAKTFVPCRRRTPRIDPRIDHLQRRRHRRPPPSPYSTNTPTTAADNTTTTTSTTAADATSDGAGGPHERLTQTARPNTDCTAYFAGHAKNPDAVAFRNLVDAATAAGGTVEVFCTPTTTTTSVTTDTALAPTDDTTSTHGHGNSGSTPGATAPGRMSSATRVHGKP
jgi:hypothetical protein